MNPASAETSSGLAEPELPGEGWSRSRWIFLIAFVLAAHVAFIFIFGTKKQIAPRAVTNVPQLQLADDASELIALDDPTLFALPHANDFASAVWLRTPTNEPPSFGWTEAPRWLKLDAEKLGAAFNEFMQTNRFAEFQLDFKPEPRLAEPVLPVEFAPQNSTLQISGDLAQRRLLNQINLPSLPHNDVLPPGKVQALVDAAGNVVSVVLLEASGLELADTNALAFARTARFAPAAQLTFGELIFNWHTVPAAATNTNANP
ncbi:MAG TPA: hypothetical protein DCQ92_09725 [Verrucomicrobia subdivision 3 bacterium]|nr:hypothetical protein [Limisphaerales bacterium]